ncbi:DUF6079 family protein [Natronospora cellulosivora (SeqCode)]
MKIKELINFEEIKDVVDIDNDTKDEESSKKLVSNYIFSKNIKGHLKILIEDFAKPKHRSAQIIGNYGSGKSHLLGILAAVLDNPELSDYIQDSEIKDLLKENLKRKFKVIQFELQPSAAPLSHFFYDRLELKLKEKYGIEIPPIDPEKVYDHKEKVKEILNIIKVKDPQMGLVVIIDEVSDFLKQKETKEQKMRDNQFLRVLAQASQSMDFVFIGSMQENVLTDEKYTDERDSFGRVSERFQIITISKEDIKKVISTRILNKDIAQREEIKELLSKYGEQIPQVQHKMDEFIELYPIHPYLIQIFNQLPYFERRGVIQFTMDKVKEILDEEFPEFITYDKIYDEIASKHMIKTLDEVAPVINAVNTLSTKVDLLRSTMQEDAKKVIKALAVLKLYSKTTNNGATPEELANELLVIDDKFTNTDRIKLILSKLREVTDGQFIAKTKNDYYYIDLDHDIDYDVVISRKAESLYNGAEDDEFLKIIKKNFELETNSESDKIFPDYSYWKDKKSFRKGSFIYDDGSENLKLGEGDFNFVLVSHLQTSSKFRSSDNTAVLNIKYNEKMDELLKRIAAISSLRVNSAYPKNIMDTKQRAYITELEEILLKLLLESAIDNGGKHEKAGHLFAQEPDNLSEYYYEVKPALFNKHFTERYPEYPDLINRLSPENIQGEVERTMKDILNGGEQIVVSNSQNLLSALDLLDSDNYLDTSQSKYAKVIMKILNENEGKNVKVDDVIAELSQKPFGLDKELVYLILIVLTYNGEINMKQRGGRTITASDLSQLFSIGLEKFREIPYISLETEFPVEDIIKLFKVLDLPAGYVRNQSDRPKAVKEFKDKVIDIKNKIHEVDNKLDRLKNKPNDYIDINALLRKREGLDNIPMDKFNLVNTISDFKKLKLDKFELEKLEIGLKFMENLILFLNDFEENIYDNYNYIEGSLENIKEHSLFFEDEDIATLEKLAKDCEEIIDAEDLMPIIEHEKRRILKGKMEQYKRKYMAIYYRQHRKKVGEDLNWDRLEEIKNSKEKERLNKLKGVRSVINASKYTRTLMTISKLDGVKCHHLKEEHLEDNYTCVKCGFPSVDDPELTDVNSTIDDIWNEILDLKEDWEERIVLEIENYQDNIDKLIAAEQTIINDILSKNKLPEEIDNQLIKALNNIFSELQEVEISKEEIMEKIFIGNGVLDYNMFATKLDEIKEWVLAQGERDNIRIKIKADEEA